MSPSFIYLFVSSSTNRHRWCSCGGSPCTCIRRIDHHDPVADGHHRPLAARHEIGTVVDAEGTRNKSQGATHPFAPPCHICYYYPNLALSLDSSLLLPSRFAGVCCCFYVVVFSTSGRGVLRHVAISLLHG